MCSSWKFDNYHQHNKGQEKIDIAQFHFAGSVVLSPPAVKQADCLITKVCTERCHDPKHDPGHSDPGPFADDQRKDQGCKDDQKRGSQLPVIVFLIALINLSLPFPEQHNDPKEDPGSKERCDDGCDQASGVSVKLSEPIVINGRPCRLPNAADHVDESREENTSAFDRFPMNDHKIYGHCQRIDDQHHRRVPFFQDPDPERFLLSCQFLFDFLMDDLVLRALCLLQILFHGCKALAFDSIRSRLPFRFFTFPDCTLPVPFCFLSLLSG